ncbi:MAG TPA: DUF4129 domain-containing protein [Iamia sp.]
MASPPQAEDGAAGPRSWRPAAIVAAALAAIVVLAALADGRLLVADPDPSAVTAADVRLARSLLRGATPPDDLVEACVDEEGTIDPACLGDGELPDDVEEIATEVVPRECRRETSVSAECLERELGIDVPEECVGSEGGVDVSCLTGQGTLVVLTDQCLSDGRLHQECLTTGVYGVPDRATEDAPIGKLPFPAVGAGTDPLAEAPDEPSEPSDPDPTGAQEEDVGRSLGEILALVIQVLALALLAGLAVFLVVVAIRTLRDRGRGEGPVVGPGAHEDAHDRAVMAASLEASARRLDPGGDPRDAIIAAYAMLLDGLAACAQGRDPSETPLEHLERVLAALDVRPEPLRELTALFGEARFSDHAMTDEQRDRARAALEAAAADLDRVRETVG